jgi:hypothetical protein
MLFYRRKEPNLRLLEYEPAFLMEEEKTRDLRTK